MKVSQLIRSTHPASLHDKDGAKVVNEVDDDGRENTASGKKHSTEEDASYCGEEHVYLGISMQNSED